jgi:pyruvate dehydrogenase E1 component
LEGGYILKTGYGQEGYEPGDNVVKLFVMGSLVTEALTASEELLQRGIFADIIMVTSPELLLGILGEQDDYFHLRTTLGVSADLHLSASASSSRESIAGLAGRRVPCVAICDGEAGLLDNVGSVVGVRCRTLAVRKFSKCGRPDEVFRYQDLDPSSIIEACGQVLSETALENLTLDPAVLSQLANGEQKVRANWRDLWPSTE